MTNDRLDDTEYQGKNWCPTCDPDRDQVKEMLNILWCSSHEPARVGLDDERVTHSGYLSGSAEAGGEENAAWCNRFAPAWETISKEDLMWLVGLLEGEGCFTGGATNPEYPGNYYPRLVLQMTDKDVVERAAGLMGTKIFARSRLTKGWKTIYQTGLVGWKAEAWMALLRPYMGLRRGKTIESVFRLYRGSKNYKPFPQPIRRETSNKNMVQDIPSGAVATGDGLGLMDGG